MGAVNTPVFYIFSFVAAASAIIVCGFEWITALTAAFLILLAACAAADNNKGIVPDLLPVLIAVLAVVRIVLDGIDTGNLISHLAGSIVISVPMLIIAILIKNGFGGGDIKMMAAAGLFLGLDKTLIAAVIAFCIAGIYGLLILLTRKKGAKSKVKLAPYLALGCAFSELFGAAFMEIFRSFL